MKSIRDQHGPQKGLFLGRPAAPNFILESGSKIPVKLKQYFKHKKIAL